MESAVNVGAPPRASVIGTAYAIANRRITRRCGRCSQMAAQIGRQTMQRPRLDLTSAVRLAELADVVVPFSIRVAGDLGVADHLHGGPVPLDALAGATGTHAPSLRRMMRALATFGIFCEVERERFALTPVGELLRADHPRSLRDAYPFVPAEVLAWERYEQ